MSAKHEAKHFMIREGAEWLSRLDDLRRRESDLPSRSEMVRRLVNTAWHAPPPNTNDEQR